MVFPVITAAPGGHGFQNYDLVNQLNEPTEDGKPDENARMNCVFASFASVVMELKPGVKTDGDFIKDHAYGPNYTGGSSGEHVAPFVEKQWGIQTDIIHSSDRAHLIQVIKDSLDKKHPVIISMPSQWNSQPSKAGYNPNSPSFGTHAGVAFHYTDTEIWVMNPWGGFVHKGTFAYWQERLCWEKVYVCSLKEGTSGVSGLSYTVDADGNLSYQSGKLGAGFSAYVQTSNITADLDIPDTSFTPTESFCVFKDGRVLYWSQATGVLDMGMCGRIVKSMYSRPAPAVKVDMSKFIAELNQVIEELKAA